MTTPPASAADAAFSTTSGSATSPDPDATDLATALATRTVVLDGGLSTQLERAGYDISSDLWSAALLREAPEAALAAHRAFFAAGAEVATTASYQASYEGFAAVGVAADEVTELLRRSVRLAREAMEGVPGRWVAASVGPFGAVLAGGQEYTGEYARPGADDAMDVEALRAWHRPRLEVLAAAGADVLAVETIPAAREAEALIAEVAVLGVPAWVSLTTVTHADGSVRTRLGEPAENVFALARDVQQIVAVGVNCTDPDGVTAAVRVAAAASGKPVVVYPNSGETWDGTARRWRGDPDLDPGAVADWVAAGARLIGGCCRVGPAQIRELAVIMQSTTAPTAVVSLMSVLPLASAFTTATADQRTPLRVLADSLVSQRDHATLAAVFAFCAGALLYYLPLYRARLVPRWLSGWGVVAVLLMPTACVMALLSDGAVTAYWPLAVPIGVQEIVLAVWLLVRNFTFLPHAGRKAKPTVHLDLAPRVRHGGDQPCGDARRAVGLEQGVQPSPDYSPAADDHRVDVPGGGDQRYLGRQ